MRLNNNFDDVAKRLQKETACLKSLESFFKDFARQCDSNAKSMQTLFAALGTQTGSSTYSVQTTLQTLSQEMQEFCGQLRSTAKKMQDDLVEPLELFRDHFDKNAAKFAKSGNGILGEMNSARKHADHAKESYAKSAAKLERLRTELRSLVRESGDPFNEATEKKTSIEGDDT